MVAAMRRAASSNGGTRSAISAAWYFALSKVAVAMRVQQSFSLGLADLGNQAIDDRLGCYALGTRAVGQCNAVTKDRMGQRHHVVDRGREAALDQRAGASRQHQGLAGARAGTPSQSALHFLDGGELGTAGTHHL